MGEGYEMGRGGERRRTWTELPVWKPHQTKMAEKEMTSLGGRGGVRSVRAGAGGQGG